MRTALLFLLAFIVLAGPVSAQQTPFRPVATVNQSMITAWDVEQRAQMLRVLGAPTQDSDRLIRIALDRLIENRLMLQAGKRAGIEPNPDLIEEGMRQLAARVQVGPDALRARLTQSGISEDAVADMVGAQIVWREVVRSRFLGQVEPGEAEIDAEIALSGATQRGGAFRLQEIGLPFDGEGRSEAETRALADRLFRQLSQGGDFAAAVRTHSRAPSAAQGGDAGWVPASELSQGLVRTLAGLEPGGVAPPFAVPSGLMILKVLDRRGGGAVGADDPELREQVRQRLLNQRIELLAQGLIQELRRDAMIEMR
ncbi:MAG: peptidylprolyl isomerase [Pseudomonadota bacterium]